ncbi:fungal pheromone mating factor STE2 GPCR-domain-containing protein [Xylariaceae sp. FL0255]|nr:fungal pheromone mating factor STE2 GPCR-domain-containing protein [Xylariaceae sp. FL0255]
MPEPPPPPPFDPTTQSFTLVASNGSTVTISLLTIEAQRHKLANTTINYGVQLGLCILSLIIVLLLLPTFKLRQLLPATQLAAIITAVIRLVLLVLYFPGPLTGYYVAWTRDASVLAMGDYIPITVSNGFAALQVALIEASLVMQCWALVRTWSGTGCCACSTSSSLIPRIRDGGKEGGRGERAREPIRLVKPFLLTLSIFLATATVVLKVLYSIHFSREVRGNLLPLPLDCVGKAAVVLAAASIFFFEGIFVAHIAGHLVATRGVLKPGGRRGLGMGNGKGVKGGWKVRGTSERGLTSLEILALGNGVLMILPSLFAGLDIAAGPANTKVLPFDAGSWVQTLVAAGLPMISLVAFYRGSDARARSDLRRISLFASPNAFSTNPEEESGTRDSTTLGGGDASHHDNYNSLRASWKVRGIGGGGQVERGEDDGAGGIGVNGNQGEGNSSSGYGLGIPGIRIHTP